MNPRYFTTAVIVVVYLSLSILTAVLKTDSSGNEFCGPTMCERLCNQEMGCSSYIYQPLFLVCHRTSDKSAQGGRGKDTLVLKNKERVYAENNLNCVSQAKIFYSRKKCLLCRRQFSERRRHEELTKLLFLPTSKLQTPRQLNLHNNSIEPYPYITGNVYAAAYIHTLQKLLVATLWPDELFTVSPDGRYKTLLIKDHMFCGVATDENKQLLFLTSNSPNVGISVMTVEGRNFKTLVKFKSCGKASGIATDSRRDILYAECTYRYIDKYTYNGTLLEKYDTKVMPSSMSVDTKNDLLYYLAGKRSVIYKLPLSERLTENVVVAELSFEGSSLYFVGNLFYIVRHNNYGTIFIINPNGKQIRSNYGIKKCTVRLCAIP